MEPVLCCIKGSFAFFTTQALSDQWGDDWNDAPYEHNAGDPYEWREGYSKEPRYEIVGLYFEIDASTPEQLAGLNSAYSVEGINAGQTAWLTPNPYAANPIPPIMAGISLSEFKRLIKAHGGSIYTKEG